jgi:hypothetical protein
MSDLGDSISKIAIDGTTLSNDNVAFPCGLIGKYFFNDTYKLSFTTNSSVISIDETNIAH